MDQPPLSPLVFALISGAWGLAMVVVLIAAIRICYRIERRSGVGAGAGSLPRYANVIPVAFNVGVARDAQTQGMRRRMNRLLLVILAGFLLFWLFLAVARAAPWT